MEVYGLNTGCGLRWQLRMNGSEEWMDAAVPGSVYQALLDNDKMEDPYYRDNELRALKLMDNDFTYRTVFTVPASMMDHEKVLLRFEGIDTIGDIYLNDAHIAYVETCTGPLNFL